MILNVKLRFKFKGSPPHLIYGCFIWSFEHRLLLELTNIPKSLPLYKNELRAVSYQIVAPCRNRENFLFRFQYFA